MNEGEHGEQRGQAAVSSSADDEDKDGQGSAGLVLCANGQHECREDVMRSKKLGPKGCGAP